MINDLRTCLLGPPRYKMWSGEYSPATMCAKKKMQAAKTNADSASAKRAKKVAELRRKIAEATDDLAKRQRVVDRREQFASTGKAGVAEPPQRQGFKVHFVQKSCVRLFGKRSSQTSDV